MRLPGIAFACAGFALVLAGCQQQMGGQPSYKPQDENPMFADHRAARPLVPGTVFRGDLRADDALYTGKVNGKEVDEFPIKITREVLERGENRFNIYCSPCHSKLGDGNGMIVQRGVSRPPSYYEDRLLTAPLGHIYDVITNGYGRMYSYDHVPVRDRWCIVAYVKTLQIRHEGKLSDVPPALQPKLEAITTGTVSMDDEKQTADASEPGIKSQPGSAE